MARAVAQPPALNGLKPSGTRQKKPSPPQRQQGFVPFVIERVP
jgi:hypothetical protein